MKRSLRWLVVMFEEINYKKNIFNSSHFHRCCRNREYPKPPNNRGEDQEICEALTKTSFDFSSSSSAESRAQVLKRKRNSRLELWLLLPLPDHAVCVVLECCCRSFTTHREPSEAWSVTYRVVEYTATRHIHVCCCFYGMALTHTPRRRRRNGEEETSK